MLPVFYIGKRTLIDILRTGVFWGAVAIAGFICFAMFYWGWHTVEAEIEREGMTVASDESTERRRAHGSLRESDPDWQEGNFDPFEQFDPKNVILWWAYGVTIGVANLLSIFAMMGLLSREIDRRTIDTLLARPVYRGQVYFGKLLAGCAAAAIFVALMTVWSLLCMVWGGMGVQRGYLYASAVGSISPCLIGALTLTLTLWMRSLLAGLLGTIITFGAGTGGLFMIKLLGVQVLKMETLVWVLYKILPPLNVIGRHATDHLQRDFYLRFVQGMFEEMGPSAADGLYSEMWHVYVYLAIVVLIGWLSFSRRQFG